MLCEGLKLITLLDSISASRFIRALLATPKAEDSFIRYLVFLNTIYDRVSYFLFVKYIVRDQIIKIFIVNSVLIEGISDLSD